MKILILESSTSSAKAMFYDTDGISRVVTEPYGFYDTARQDADTVWAKTLKAGKCVLASETVDMIALSGTYTGSMLVPHEPVPGFLENPITVNTKDFFDIGLKAAYDFKLYKSMNLQINAGIQNIFNAYQDDFDKGADRDSGYIYGPSLPRSFFAGVKISY